MNVVRTDIRDVLILEPRVFADDRGFFFESYSERELRDVVGADVPFLQDNHSRSRRGVLRGLHYQRAPHAQGKLVRVVAGAVFDVAVDLRRSSPTFGRWVAVELSAENRRQMWIPPGLAHGFLTLSETADVLYKATTYYAPEAEGCIRWDDPELAIAWPDVGAPPVLSPKDAAAPPLSRAVLGDDATMSGSRP
ncbi:MAG TPA: dTDP-4-dehydrorhamnose 3,5-epimerase [Anaeromyxobacteraceae bacterium]|nr:dTDP-4-dehydrorhamnose 3,5-epimerase [Anaeromyxobacteraceae bacterium]